MMALTHAAIAGSIVTLSLGDCSPLVLGLAIAGSQLPDIDTSKSTIGSIFFPASRWLEARFPHRSITHSFLASGAIALFGLPLYFYLGWKPWAALVLSHAVACFSDTFTKQGVQLFWPAPVWCVRGLNPNRRLTTGGPGEYWVLATAVTLLVTSFYLYNSGGAMAKASQVIGLKSGQERLYNQNAGTSHVWAQVTGVRASDRADVSGKFWIAGMDGNEYVLSDGKSLFKTGDSGQIIPSRLVVEVGNPATTKAYSLVFDDEDPLTTLVALKKAHPGAAVFLSGELESEDVADLKTTPSPNRMQTLLKNDAQTGVRLFFHPIDEAIADLENAYVTGTLTAKVISPSPFGGVQQPGQRFSRSGAG